MLIFLVPQDGKVAVVRQVVLDYKKTFPDAAAKCKVVPWYDIEPEPEEFAARLLEVAEGDDVCIALAARATEQWKLNFAIERGTFVTPLVQEQYLKLLKNWLNPLSGNLHRREAHLKDVEQIYKTIWLQYGLTGDFINVSKHKFFSLNVSGRRDRAQIYRSLTEAARALVGEVTSWPSRQVEKMTVLSLLRSPALAALQRRMLGVVVAEKWTDKFTYTMWEYLPYYLRGVPLEKVRDEVAAPRVLGALHDCLWEGEETRKDADEKVIDAFKNLEGGKEYARWRLLPPVIRNQVMISDLARILPGKKIECEHERFELDPQRLEKLPGLEGFSAWSSRIVAHKTANPHDPGRTFPFAAGWVRNEFCPNVVSSRLLLAPLYAGTSGHTQGRILAWRALNSEALREVPVGLIIATGYAVLWRLYYDKRVSGFHTLFEALQGSHVDKDYRPGNLPVKLPPPRRPNKDDFLPLGTDDDMMSLLMEWSPGGGTEMRGFWFACLRRYGRSGPGFVLAHKEALAQEREATMRACPGTVIPHWSETDEPDKTAPEVAVWSSRDNQQIMEAAWKVYNAWTEEAAKVPLPLPLDEEGL